VSLLTDAASDMILPLVPAFLLSLGGGAAALGWVEGIAEAVAAALKLGAGRASDHARRRKPLVALGYGISALARPLFAFALVPAHVVAIRAADRVGKGLRGPSRDAMVADATPPEQRGQAFGFHRMMDNFGGVLGPLAAFLLLRLARLDVRTLFAASLVPGLLSVAVVLAAVREPAHLEPESHAAHAPAEERAGSEPLPPAARRYLGAVLLFSLASSTDLFLVERLTDLGLDLALVPAAWVSLQLMKGLVNVPGGRAADRYGRKRVLAIAWALYAASYAGFGLASSWAVGWALLAVYALHYGLAEGAQRALLAEYVGRASRGRGYGAQLAVEGAMVLPANVLFGVAYDRAGATIAFVAAGAIAALAAAALAWIVPAAPASPRAAEA
jgi:MFS family permease